MEVDARVLSVSMTDASGHALFDTLAPFGTDLAPLQVAHRQAPLFRGVDGLVSLGAPHKPQRSAWRCLCRCEAVCTTCCGPPWI